MPAVVAAGDGHALLGRIEKAGLVVAAVSVVVGAVVALEMEYVVAREKRAVPALSLSQFEWGQLVPLRFLASQAAD